MSRTRAVALAAAIVGAVVASGCGSADNGGVIEGPTTTTVDLPRSGP